MSAAVAHINVHPVGCGACAAGPALPPACHAMPAERCLNPEMRGDALLLKRAVDSLRQVVDPAGGRSLVDLHLVKSLCVEFGEAVLTLTFAPRCGNARDLALNAFDSLRRALPETDIYVRHTA